MVGVGRSEEWEVIVNGYGILVLQNKKSSGDWLHNSVNVHYRTVHLKIIKVINFRLCVFYHIITKYIIFKTINHDVRLMVSDQRN